jgi:cytochrome c oxidase subunit 1
MATTAAPARPTIHATYEPGKSGVWSWLTTVDHKRIGMLYLMTALSFFIGGGLEALFIRMQLQAP